MALVTMRVAITEGCGVEKAVGEMLSFANLAGVNLETEIRGIRIYVSPGDDAAEIVKSYNRIDAVMLHAARDATKRKS